MCNNEGQLFKSVTQKVEKFDTIEFERIWQNLGDLISKYLENNMKV